MEGLEGEKDLVHTKVRNRIHVTILVYVPRHVPWRNPLRAELPRRGRVGEVLLVEPVLLELLQPHGKVLRVPGPQVVDVGLLVVDVDAEHLRLGRDHGGAHLDAAVGAPARHLRRGLAVGERAAVEDEVPLVPALEGELAPLGEEALVPLRGDGVGHALLQAAQDLPLGPLAAGDLVLGLAAASGGPRRGVRAPSPGALVGGARPGGLEGRHGGGRGGAVGGAPDLHLRVVPWRRPRRERGGGGETTSRGIARRGPVAVVGRGHAGLDALAVDGEGSHTGIRR